MARSDVLGAVAMVDLDAVQAKASVRVAVAVEVGGVVAPQAHEVVAEFDGPVSDLGRWAADVCDALDAFGARFARATGRGVRDGGRVP